MSPRCMVRRLRMAVGAVAVAVTAGFVLPMTGAVAVQHGPPVSSQTPLPVSNGSAHDLGAYNSSQTIRLSIGLRPPRMAAEQQFLNQLQDKRSPFFHHYLTTAQWTAQFGPSAAAQQAVVSWARGAGLTVTKLYPNRLVVDLAGQVGAVEKALGVQINNYRLGATTFYANNHDPVLPKSLATIVESVEGLSDLQTMFPASPSASEPASPAYSPGPVVANGPHAAASGNRAKLPKSMQTARDTAARGALKPDITNGAYDPTDIYSSQAYDYNALYGMGHCCNPLGNAGSSPPQSSIAIATFGSQNLSDMAGFQAQYPYLAYSVQEINIDGTPTCCDEEGTMDMEWSTAMSNSFGSYQDTAKVYLYDGANFNDSTFTDMYNTMVSNNLARVFSTSWSCTEIYGCNTSEMSTRDAIFSEMTGQGWTLVAASGDRGAYDDCSHLAVSFPASDPNVVGAGGTTLSLNSGPVYNSEVTWSGGPDGCSSNDGGSGGGCSSVFAAPSFQSNEPCGSGSRGVPDISLNADWYNAPQNIYFGGALGGNGGTSIVAPELAGFFAQEDSYLLYEGSICGSGSSACAPLGNANYPIYESALEGAPHDPFYDITSGCNSNNIGVGYCAGSGYDLATGWGSANMLQLAWAFNWHLLADDGRPVVTFSGPTPGVWYRTDQTVGVSVVDTGGSEPASGVAGFSDAWNSDPGDPTSEATPGTGNSFYSGPEFVNTGSGSLDLAAEGQGCNTVDVEAWDNMGLQSGDVTDGPLCYDSVAPTITAVPTVKLRTHVTDSATAASVAISWKGTDATSGVNHYTLYQSKDGGAFTQIASTTAVTLNKGLAPGHSYRFEVSATDNAGNTSAVKAGATYKLALIQENGSAVKYSTGWTRQKITGSNGGYVDYANVAGKTATLSFTGFQVGWITTLGPIRGSATVKLGSAAAQTINTNATPAKTAYVADVLSGTNGAHQLVIKVLGTAGHPRIDIDAFIVLSG
jgi:Pro-kumamolisin, activation domain